MEKHICVYLRKSASLLTLLNNAKDLIHIGQSYSGTYAGKGVVLLEFAVEVLVVVDEQQQMVIGPQGFTPQMVHEVAGKSKPGQETAVCQQGRRGVGDIFSSVYKIACRKHHHPRSRLLNPVKVTVIAVAPHLVESNAAGGRNSCIASHQEFVRLIDQR